MKLERGIFKSIPEGNSTKIFFKELLKNNFIFLSLTILLSIFAYLIVPLGMRSESGTFLSYSEAIVVVNRNIIDGKLFFYIFISGLIVLVEGLYVYTLLRRCKNEIYMQNDGVLVKRKWKYLPVYSHTIPYHNMKFITLNKNRIFITFSNNKAILSTSSIILHTLGKGKEVAKRIYENNSKIKIYDGMNKHVEAKPEDL